MTSSRPGYSHASHIEEHSVIEPSFDLRERAVRAGSARDVDKLLAKAEAELAELKQEFPQWMLAELDELEKSWTAYRSGAPHARAGLFRRIHDLRGQASTFGFPLAGKAADLLCRLMDALQTVPADVIEAHIQAIRVIIRDKITTEDHAITVEMLKALDNLGHGLIVRALKLAEDKARGEA